MHTNPNWTITAFTTLLGCLSLASADANGCDVSEFKQYVNYKGDQELYYHLVTLNREEENRAQTLQSNAAFNFLGILSGNGTGGTASSNARSYLKTMDETYTARKSEEFVLSQLNDDGLNAYIACLNRSGGGLRVTLGKTVGNQLAVHWIWAPEASAPNEEELIIRGASLPMPAVKYFQERWGFWRKHVSSLWTDKTELDRVPIFKNQAGLFYLPVAQKTYRLDARVGLEKPQEIRVPGLEETQIHYFQGQPLNTIHRETPNATEVTGRYDELKDKKRLILIRAGADCHHGVNPNLWATCQVGIYTTLDGEEEHPCGGGERAQAHKSSHASAECRQLVPRSKGVQIRVVAITDRVVADVYYQVVH